MWHMLEIFLKIVHLLSSLYYIQYWALLLSKMACLQYKTYFQTRNIYSCYNSFCWLYVKSFLYFDIYSIVFKENLIFHFIYFFFFKFICWCDNFNKWKTCISGWKGSRCLAKCKRSYRGKIKRRPKKGMLILNLVL